MAEIQRSASGTFVGYPMFRIKTDSMVCSSFFVKTSAGFSGGGATVDDIRLMRSTVPTQMRIKASGGIRDYATAVAMIEAGADRIGASASVGICEGAEDVNS